MSRQTSAPPSSSPVLVLASTSQSRRDMLSAAGVPFEAAAPHVDEEELKLSLRAAGAAPRDMADALAEAKALKVSQRLPGVLVLGGDQILETDDGDTLDKAPDMAAQRTQLLALRGRPHTLIAAAIIALDGRPVWRHADTARLFMRNFSEAWLDDYLALEGEALLWGVGGYRIEGRGAQLFERLTGDQFTVRGLPLLPLLSYLRDRGVLAV